MCWLSLFPACPSTSAGLRSSFAYFVVPLPPAQRLGVGPDRTPPFERHPSLYPRGPRSARVVLSRASSLAGPIRPTRRYSATSPLAAYTRCLRGAGTPWRPASGSALSLCSPCRHVVLCVPGDLAAADPVLDGDAAFAQMTRARLSTMWEFRGLQVRHCYDLPTCSPPQGRLLHPGFRRVGHPSRRWI